MKEEEEDNSYLDDMLQEVHQENVQHFDWVAAEEECVSTNTDNCTKTVEEKSCIDFKSEQDVGKTKKGIEENPIRIYKVKKEVRKTLKKMKLDVRSARKKVTTGRVAKKITKSASVERKMMNGSKEKSLLRKRMTGKKVDTGYPKPKGN